MVPDASRWLCSHACCSLQELPRFPTDPPLGPEKSCASSTTMQKRWGGVHLLSRRVLAYVPCLLWLKSKYVARRCWWGRRWRTGWGSRSATGTPSVQQVLRTHWRDLPYCLSCIKLGLFIQSPLVGLSVTRRSWSLWLPNPAPALEWRDACGCSQEATPGSFRVLHQAGSERHFLPLWQLCGWLWMSFTLRFVCLFSGEILHVSRQVTHRERRWNSWLT